MSKTWFITGSSRGFGRRFAEAALSRGDKVAATARNTDSLTDLVAAYGDAILPLPLDVTDKAAVTEAVKLDDYADYIHQRRSRGPSPTSSASWTRRTPSRSVPRGRP
jgi:NADP-dependent 3-hydroxy acid dehydrogenase YdfG